MVRWRRPRLTLRLKGRFAVDGAPIVQEGQVIRPESEIIAAAAARLIMDPADGDPFEMAK